MSVGLLRPEFAPVGKFPSFNDLLSTTDYVKAGQRFALVDGLKGMAACTIVWHHLCEYSPSADRADQFAPNLLYCVYNYGLFVVHVFLVLGGFGLAMGMKDQPISGRQALASFGSRYVRLAAPYLVMLLLLLIVSWSSFGLAMRPPLIESFSWPQLVANVFLLQDILGLGNLSAGTWYLCIDLQYVGLFLLIQTFLSTIRRIIQKDFSKPMAMSAMLFPVGLVSVWYWNRVLEYEVYVFYFMGSMVLGTLLAWTLKGRIPGWVLLIYAAAMAASLVIDLRARVFVALGTGLIVYIGVRFWPNLQVPRPLVWLGKISYSLFLIHYLVNGVVLHGLDSWIGDSPFRAFMGMVIAFLASLFAATALFYAVEAPCHRWLKSFERRANPSLSPALTESHATMS